ncbi:hypothetical protein [Halomonas sp. 707B3]|uniref:hypothetical protein n=1 Tax=Halomonas sp. 707B3 TaxID=1681043 RepID=UPI0020A21AEC|nr:hypothetical protein [Halomonas sp. 707B3]MCP1316412.1 hypothetical protein [Halomonas sp. 707B3]
MQAFMKMPKACVSCDHYQQVGKDYDTHCPFPDRYRLEGQTPYGRCKHHGVEVFATQVCGAHQHDPLIECVDVTNRPEPRAPIQEGMAL